MNPIIYASSPLLNKNTSFGHFLLEHRSISKHFLCLTLLFLYSLAQGEDYRVWTDRSGREIDAVFVSQTDSEITVRYKDNRKQISFSKELLSAKDLDYLSSLGETEAFSSLLQNTPSDLKSLRALYRKSDLPVLILWQNLGNDEGFQKRILEMTKGGTLEQLLEGRAQLAIIPSGTEFDALHRDYQGQFQSPAFLVTYRDAGNFSRIGLLKLDKPVDYDFASLDEAILAYEDHYPLVDRSFPDWPSDIKGEPDTLFEAAALARRSNLPFLITYRNGVPKEIFQAAVKLARAEINKLCGDTYVHVFVSDDEQLRRRISLSHPFFEKSICQVMYDQRGYQRRTQIASNTKTHADTLAEKMTAFVESSIARKREIDQSNSDPNDPFAQRL